MTGRLYFTTVCAGWRACGPYTLRRRRGQWHVTRGREQLGFRPTLAEASAIAEKDFARRDAETRPDEDFAPSCEPNEHPQCRCTTEIA